MVRTFDDEVKALEDYGHDCCARIDDRIHECCERIREAHQNEFSQMLKIYEVAVEFMKGDADAVDARPSDAASSDSPVHGSAGCACGGGCGCDGEELLAPITTELRDSMAYVTNTFSGDDEVRMDEEEFIRLCDNIDAIHAGLERDYKVACDVNERQDHDIVVLAKMLVAECADKLTVLVGRS